ncbi:hypothetical protein [Litorimonas haliclonae]|uniref:hypothetical protein n=1 Tax=Litorimonas haliclonae TaxID=2081977 RepID=UPI0039F04E9F
MILQLRSQTLATLLARDSGYDRQAKAILRSDGLAQSDAKSPPPSETVCNDRTSLNHPKIK